MSKYQILKLNKSKSDEEKGLRVYEFDEEISEEDLVINPSSMSVVSGSGDNSQKISGTWTAICETCKEEEETL